MQNKTFTIIILATCLLLLCFADNSTALSRIGIPFAHSNDPRHDYFHGILKLALDKTVAEYDEYELIPHRINAEQGRHLRMILEADGVDITWSMTTVERERNLIPIRIPLLKGLLGYRVFIITPTKVNKFKKVTSFRRLCNLKAGQGHDWPDATILEHNGMSVVKVPRYHLLFEMLLENRFDYFPRGLSEVYAEIDQHRDEGLVVEQNIMLHYPAPIYFFVSPQSKALANRVEKGLKDAINDGSFDNFFYSHPQLQPMFQQENFAERTIYNLENPLLPPETPLNDMRLWFDPTSIKPTSPLSN